MIKKFLTKPKNFKWDELVTMLNGFGYVIAKGRKTGGSRARFVHESLPPVIPHRPHPSALLKRYQIEQLNVFLKEEGLI
ncbi:MAG: type II toxin-antitoxin system HicA family toxin [Nitrospinota bacterium]